jgi:hypothetical protein
MSIPGTLRFDDGCLVKRRSAKRAFIDAAVDGSRWPVCCLAHVPDHLHCIVGVVPEERPGDDIKTRVDVLIDAASVATTGHVSVVNRDVLTDALTHDLEVAAEQATGDRERLAKLETQTQALADAVIAIADTGPSPAVIPAVDAVKAKMSGQPTKDPVL